MVASLRAGFSQTHKPLLCSGLPTMAGLTRRFHQLGPSECSRLAVTLSDRWWEEICGLSGLPEYAEPAKFVFEGHPHWSPLLCSLALSAQLDSAKRNLQNRTPAGRLWNFLAGGRLLQNGYLISFSNCYATNRGAEIPNSCLFPPGLGETYATAQISYLLLGGR